MNLKIGFIIIALLTLTLLVLLALRVRNDLAARTIWQALETSPAEEKFIPELVEDLPKPVQRYFLHAIQLGTPLFTSVQLEMQGKLKLGQGWMSMQGNEILSTQGFLWRAVVGNGLIRFVVADRYIHQAGRVYVTLWGAVPIVNQQDANITRASIGRLAIESIWLPSVLLPQRGVQWQVLEENTIQARFQIDSEPIALTLVIDADGRLLKAMMPRWGEDKAKGTFAYLPYGAAFSEEATFEGYTIPAQLGIGWGFGTENYQETLQATVSHAFYR